MVECKRLGAGDRKLTGVFSCRGGRSIARMAHSANYGPGTARFQRAAGHQKGLSKNKCACPQLLIPPSIDLRTRSGIEAFRSFSLLLRVANHETISSSTPAKSCPFSLQFIEIKERE